SLSVINFNIFFAASLPISNVGCFTTLVGGVEASKNGESSIEITLICLGICKFFDFKNFNNSIKEKSFTAKNAFGKSPEFHIVSNSFIIFDLFVAIIHSSQTFN